ncbi:MAG: translation initiation factor eIF-2B [Candidatus Aenigmatarchaeota archaeon]
MDIEDIVDETVEKIKDLEIQGAQEIAVESLEVLRDYAEERGFGPGFEEAADRLKNARPTGVSAHNCIEYVKRHENLKSLERILDYLDEAKRKAAKNAADLIEDGEVIMTHCHSSVVIESFRKAKDDGKNFTVIVTETEPKLQGLKTAKELVRADIPIHYIVDSAAGLFMWAADKVFVGVDAVKPDGVLNKIGTYLMSLAAKEDPEAEFYFLATKDKFDYDNFSEIEERRPDEISHHEELEDPRVMMENPAFDLTPWACVNGLVTEEGILEEEEVIDLIIERFEI